MSAVSSPKTDVTAGPTLLQQLAQKVHAFEKRQLTKASIALLRLSSSGPIFIAQEKGWFKEVGLDLTMKDFQAAAQVPLAVVSGDADLGVTAFTAGFFNLAAKGGLSILSRLREDFARSSQTLKRR